MGTRVLCCLVLCLLGSGSFAAKVIQTPGHLVKKKGQKAKMNCIPPTGHTVVYWYQQNQNKEFQFLIYFQNQQAVDQIEMVKQRFSVEYPPNSPCSLEIRSSEPGDSALYFCASSPSTALK
ncbi:T-cell receptor beta chain V region 3H.25 [Sciurus carolinensis]|nr:T-cell receptor beta chain V region 3H.25 [Sciurus carolinensis]